MRLQKGCQKKKLGVKEFELVEPETIVATNPIQQQWMRELDIQLQLMILILFVVSLKPKR